MSNEKIINFESRAADNDIVFDYYMQQDAFLRLSFINAFRESDYDFSTNGVKEFQEDHGIEVTGLVGLEDVLNIVSVYDSNEAQKIISAVNDIGRIIDRDNMEKEKKEKKKTTKGQIKAIIWLLLFGGFFLYGVITFWIKVAHLIFH